MPDNSKDRDFFFEIGQTVRLSASLSSDGQTSKNWDICDAKVVHRYRTGIHSEDWYILMNEYGDIDSFREIEITRSCPGLPDAFGLQMINKQLEKTTPKAKRIVELMEMIGCRYNAGTHFLDKSAIISYGSYRVVVSESELKIGHTTKGKIYTDDYRDDFRGGMNFLMSQSWPDKFKVIRVPQNPLRFIKIEIEGKFKDDIPYRFRGLDGEIEQKAIVGLCSLFKGKSATLYSYNPSHVAMARGFLLGTTQDEIALEYFCEFSEDANRFVYGDT